MAPWIINTTIECHNILLILSYCWWCLNIYGSQLNMTWFNFLIDEVFSLFLFWIIPHCSSWVAKSPVTINTGEKWDHEWNMKFDIDWRTWMNIVHFGESRLLVCFSKLYVLIRVRKKDWEVHPNDGSQYLEYLAIWFKSSIT